MEIGIPLEHKLMATFHLCLKVRDNIIIPSLRADSNGGMMLNVSGIRNEHFYRNNGAIGLRTCNQSNNDTDGCTEHVLELSHTYHYQVNIRTTSYHDEASDRFSSIQYRAGDYGVNLNVLVRRIGGSATVAVRCGSECDEPDDFAADSTTRYCMERMPN
jgi:hypothetical protein